MGDRVKMAGVEVGRVEKIQLEGDKAEVIMKMNTTPPIKTDSMATVKLPG